jgi:hypothetical protein
MSLPGPETLAESLVPLADDVLPLDWQLPPEVMLEELSVENRLLVESDEIFIGSFLKNMSEEAAIFLTNRPNLYNSLHHTGPNDGNL